VRFHAGLKAQGLRKGFLPVSAPLQPYCGWFALIASCFTMVFTGYYLFAPGAFVVADFIFVYGACFIFIALFTGSKIKGVLRGEERWFGFDKMEMDFVGGVDEVEKLTLDYEQEYSSNPPKNLGQKVYRKVF
jgi:amino acid transporter